MDQGIREKSLDSILVVPVVCILQVQPEMLRTPKRANPPVLASIISRQ